MKVKYLLIDGERKRRIDVIAGKLNCDFHCGIALSMKKYSWEVEENMRLLHQYMYPEVGFLKEATDYDFLDINGGSMDYKTYKNLTQHVFAELTGLTVNHAKRSIAVL
jgi:hypothetical protein